MKAPTQKIKVGFVSLGCAKNQVDTEIMAADLLAHGCLPAASPEQADCLLINTCAFIHDAREESVAEILRACASKNKGRLKFIVVAGCLAQRYRTEIGTLFPEVDIFVGLDQLQAVGALTARLAAGRIKGQLLRISPHAHKTIEPPVARPLFTGAPYAYVKIADGCNHRCRFCAIPDIRGRTRSRSLQSILREVENLLANGIREINLIAQDVASYGRDRHDGASLPALLRVLGRINGNFWIRLLYAHPAYVDDKLLDAMAEVPQVCRYLDAPIQHSHPEILKNMGRPRTTADWSAFFNGIRDRLPGLTLRTTCLVGYPGEQLRHFRHLQTFLNDNPFEHLAVFAFSKEENTLAAQLPRQVRPATAAARRHQLLEDQRHRVLRSNRARLGQTAIVLIERPAPRRPGYWLCRGPGQAPEADSAVYLKAENTVAPGMFVKVSYTAVSGYDLLAVPNDMGS